MDVVCVCAVRATVLLLGTTSATTGNPPRKRTIFDQRAVRTSVVLLAMNTPVIRVQDRSGFGNRTRSSFPVPAARTSRRSDSDRIHLRSISILLVVTRNLRYARDMPMAITLKEQKIRDIIRLLQAQYPRPHTALRYRTSFQLLTAVILSAQCTDKKVNEVTKPIFAKYTTAKDFTALPIKRLEVMVKQTGFYKSKARAVHETARIVATRYHNRVPTTIAELTTLRGVARKTANVVIGHLTGNAEGIAVDTHVIRLSRRLGLTRQTDPVKIERDLMKIVPRKYWVTVSLWLIHHGRAVCNARRPQCNTCTLNTVCPTAFHFPQFRKAHNH